MRSKISFFCVGMRETKLTLMPLQYFEYLKCYMLYVFMRLIKKRYSRLCAQEQVVGIAVKS